MTLSLITPPIAEPLSLSDIKQHLRISDGAEDNFLQNLALAAREFLEQQINQKLISQTWRQFLDGQCDLQMIDIKIAPVQNINQITLYNKSGVPTTLSSDHYCYLKKSQQIKLLAPALLLDNSNGMEIDIEVGISNNANGVPHVLKQAMLLSIAHWYEFRLRIH